MKTPLPDLPAGVYRHYKGPLYQVLGYGHDANDESRVTVVYIGLQTQGAHTGPRLSTRTALSEDQAVDAFFDFVHPKDGSKCVAPHNCRRMLRVRRFTYLGPGIEPKHLDPDVPEGCVCGGAQHIDGGCLCGAKKATHDQR